MARVGFEEVLKSWLTEEGCEVSFQTVSASSAPTILFVQKEGKRSWFTWTNILEAWNNGLSVKTIAKRIMSCGSGKQEVA